MVGARDAVPFCRWCWGVVGVSHTACGAVKNVAFILGGVFYAVETSRFIWFVDELARDAGGHAVGQDQSRRQQEDREDDCFHLIYNLACDLLKYCIQADA